MNGRRPRRSQPHWICTFPGACLCSDSGRECTCVVLHGDTHGVCLHCLEAMICIDLETGEPLHPKGAGARVGNRVQFSFEGPIQ